MNKVCSSGLKAVELAAQSIQLGKNDVVVTGGVESMSNSPHYVNLRKPTKFGNSYSVDGMLLDGLKDVYSKESMGLLADNCASKYGISREAQDDYAKSSYKKSIISTENKIFDGTCAFYSQSDYFLSLPQRPWSCHSKLHCWCGQRCTAN